MVVEFISSDDTTIYLLKCKYHLWCILLVRGYNVFRFIFKSTQHFVKTITSVAFFFVVVIDETIYIVIFFKKPHLKSKRLFIRDIFMIVRTQKSILIKTEEIIVYRNDV